MFAGSVRSKFAFDNEIVIQVSNNVLNQMSSRVFGTLVQEIFDYKITYQNVQYPIDPMELTEKEKLFYTLEQIVT